jgi:hypothetical protein
LCPEISEPKIATSFKKRECQPNNGNSTALAKVKKGKPKKEIFPEIHHHK